jgi:hypothetical protein
MRARWDNHVKVKFATNPKGFALAALRGKHLLETALAALARCQPPAQLMCGV